MVEQGTNNRAKVIVSPRNDNQTSNEPGRERIVRFNPIGRLDFQPRQRDESLLLSSRARALLIAPLTPTCVAILIVTRVRIPCSPNVSTTGSPWINHPVRQAPSFLPPPSPTQRFREISLFRYTSIVATPSRLTYEQQSKEGPLCNLVAFLDSKNFSLLESNFYCSRSRLARRSWIGFFHPPISLDSNLTLSWST